MKSFFYILVFVLTGTYCKAQDFKKCIVYQFAGNDSSKKHIALVQTFNQRGQVVSETYSNYNQSSNEGNNDGTYYYYYDDSLLEKRVFIESDMDTNKVLYYYNCQHQCIKEEYFSCEKRLRKDVKKGIGQPGGCVVFEEDLEKNRTWKKSNEVTFTYDDKGRKIKKADDRDYTRLWKYDDQNRIAREMGYNFDKLAYIEDYSYFDGGYKCSTIYYEMNGDAIPPKYSDILFCPVYTSTYYLDRKGRIIKHEVTTEKDVKISTEVTSYDSKGRIVRTCHLYIDEHYINAREQPGITHIFEYK